MGQSREVSMIVAKSCDFNYIKHNENNIYEKNSKIKKHKNHQKIEKHSSFGINKSQKKVKSKNKTIEKRNIEKTIKVNQNSHTQKPKKKSIKIKKHHKNHQQIEKHSSFGINETQKRITSKNKT